MSTVPDQGGKLPGTHQDLTEPGTWIKRIERPNRPQGLRVPDVIACLSLKPGNVVADIGAGTAAFAIPFARAVGPSGKVLAVDIWQELLDYIADKARVAEVTNLQTVLSKPMDPNLPDGTLDLAFFHDVFHNVDDRELYLRKLSAALKPGGRIAIIEQEFDDPIAKKWDLEEDRITAAMVQGWMGAVGLHRVGEFDLFQGKNNPDGAGMPERWFVVYARDA